MISLQEIKQLKIKNKISPEQNIAIIIANGGTTRTVAKNLGISYEAAHKRIRKILKVNKAKTRPQLIAILFREGVIE